MNNTRRKKITTIMETITRLNDELEDNCSLIVDLLDEEQECLDNLPESLQDSDKAEVMQEAIEALEEVKSDGEQGHYTLKAMIDTLDKALA